MRTAIDTLRCKIGGWFHYLGYRILPPRVRKLVSITNAVGLHWVEHGCPDSFSIEINK